MPKDYEADIEAEKAAMTELDAELEDIRIRFVSAVAEFIPLWIDAHIEGLVRASHERVQGLNDAQLTNVKAKILDVRGRAGAIAVEQFDRVEPWWHRAPVSERQAGMDKTWQTYTYRTFGKRPPERLDRPLRRALGSVGPILAAAGLCSLTEDWSQSGEKGPIYPYSLDWPETLSKIAAEYDAVYAKAEDHVRTLSRLMKEKAQEETQRRWDAL